MASDAPTRELRYVVYLPDGPTANPYRIRLSEEADVQDLEDRLRDHPAFKRTLENERVQLFKCGTLAIKPPDCDDPAGERYKEAIKWLRVEDNIKKKLMDPTDPLKEYFSSAPASFADKKIDVIVVTDSIMESGDVLHPLGVNRSDLRLIQMSTQRAANVKNIRSPSETCNNPKILKTAVNTTDLYIHRPARNYGPHTSLFHHAFARLKHRLDRLDDPTTWQPDLEPSAELLALCHNFIWSSCEVFETEEERTVLLKPFFELVLSDPGSTQTLLDGGTARADATWGNPPFFIREDKTEDGMSGNSSVQGKLYYRKLVAQKSYQPYVERSNCPVIIIGIMGNRIEISTTIYIGGVYADKLISQELYIDAFQANSVLRLGRLCWALRLCYNDLKEYYRTLNVMAAPTTRHLYPNPLPAEGHDPVPALTYLCKLSHGGICIPVIQEGSKEQEDTERPYAIYLAKMTDSDGERDVVVKFTATYNKMAHQLLETEQLAPRLRYFARLVGGHCMVVTDYVVSLPLSDCLEQKNYLDVLKRVERAVQVLHGENLVFGDLRPQNIVLHPKEGAMLIDFDLAGTHGVDRYPASFDTSKHRKDVHRNGIMDKEHDIFMIAELSKLLEEKSRGSAMP